MLPAQQRITRTEDFSRVLRHGLRAGGSSLVVHLVIGGDAPANSPSRAGFVVGRAVGGSVVRHRVLRQLRHLVRERLPTLPGGSLLVVRALPGAATETVRLATDLDVAVGSAVRRARQRSRSA